MKSMREKQKDKVRKNKIYSMVTCLWIVIIFSFSLQPGETSGQISSGLGEWIIEEVLSNVIKNIEDIQPEQWEWIHFLLRKCAHFTEYFILGILMNLTMEQMKRSRKVRWTLAACVLVASTDETIQRFVEGRSGQLSDVLLDSVGALCGIGCVLIIERICRKKVNGVMITLSKPQNNVSKG